MTEPAPTTIQAAKQTPCDYSRHPLDDCYCKKVTGRSVPNIALYCMDDYRECPVYCKQLQQNSGRNSLQRLFMLCCMLTALFMINSEAVAYVITPQTWNTVGLDSNDVNAGPNLFPVGAKVCGGTAGGNVDVYFAWLSSNSYIDLRNGSKGFGGTPLNITFGADGCADAFFEAEVQRNAAVYDTSREYKIYIGSDSSPTPRALYAERLISQARNAITDVKVDGVSIPAGGAMNLIVGNTYTIDLIGGTATQGYNQFSSFFTLSNTIFQIKSVSSTFSANNSPYVPDPVFGTGLYADACRWDNNTTSLTYRSCIGGDYKAGGTNVVTTYQIKIISGGGSVITLSSLLYDFSGASFHYNGDYSTGARIANIIDPNSLTIAKNFSPNPTNVATGSTLTFTIANPNAGAISGVGFTDIFPIAPGTMQLKDTVASNTCGGTLTNNSGGPLAINDPGIKLANGTVPANGSCVVSVNVKTSATGDYLNTSQSLLIGGNSTGKTASATLKVDTNVPPSPPPSSCAKPVELARWEMNTTSLGPPGNGPLVTRKAGDVSTATANFTSTGGGAQFIEALTTHTYAWDGTGGGSGWNETPLAGSGYAMANYLEFVLDTSNYGGIGVTFDAGLFTSGDWGNPTSPIWLTSSTTGGTPFTLYASTPATIGKNAGWVPGLIAGPMTAGTNLTTFRFGTNGANKATAKFALDNIIFTGCPRTKPPVISKRFGTNPILSGGVSTLTFLIQNPNPAISLSGVSFTDTFPANMKVAATPNAVTSNCGTPTFAPAANNTTLNFSLGTISGGTTCTVKVDVTATATGVNTSGAVTATESGAGNTATDTLTVTPPDPVVSLFKEVATSASAPGPSSILWHSDIAVKAGDNVYYQFTVQNDGDVPLTDVTVTDADLAAVDPGLSLANCSWKNGDDVIITPGTPSAQNFTLAVANNSNNLDFAYCIIGPIAAVAGTKTNTATANAKYLGLGITPDSSTAKYNGFVPPTLSKAFGTGTIGTGKTTTLTLTLGNPSTNPGPLTGVKVDDTFPTGMTLKDITFTFTPAACGTVTRTDGITALVAGDGAIRLAASTIAANAACQLQVNVTSSTIGSVTNTTGTPSATGVSVAGRSVPLLLTGVTANAPLNITQASLNKAFSPTTINSGGISTLTFTITNSGGINPVQGGIDFSDNLPANVVVAAAPNIQSNCPAGAAFSINPAFVTAAAGSSAVTVTAAELNGGVSSCQVKVDVTSAVPGGPYDNSSTNIVGTSHITNSVTTSGLTVLAGGTASLTMVKSIEILSDPVNLGVSPKPIPGAIMRYTIQVINSGAGAVDLDTTKITDLIPANTVICVTDPCISFSCSALPLCGLTYTYATDVTFSKGAVYPYIPSPDADGYDGNVTKVHFNPKGTFNGNSTFNLLFKVKLR